MKKNNEERGTILNTPRKMLIPDNSGNGNHITMIVNWTPFIKDCNYIKLVMPNGDECIVQKDEFRSLMMMIAKEEDIVKMGQTQITEVKVVQKPVTIEATRDIKKGEMIHFVDTFKFEVPQQIVTGRSEEKGR